MPAPPTLIPRSILFGNPEQAAPRLSPDGARIGWLAPDEGVLNVWVQDSPNAPARVVTHDRETGVRSYFFAEDDEHLLYLQDKDGDEDWHLWAVGFSDGDIRDLTPHEGVRVGDLFTDPKRPNEILVGMNRRDPQVFDLHRLNLATGEEKLEAENRGDYVGWLIDHSFRVRGATAACADGGFELLVSRKPGGDFESFLRWGPEDNGSAIGFAPGQESLYIEDSLHSDTTELYEIGLDGAGRRVLARRDGVDVGSLIVHPTTHRVQAAGFALHRLEWEVLDSSIEPDLRALGDVAPGEIVPVSRDRADRRWLVSFSSDLDPGVYWSYDREGQGATHLFDTRPELKDYTLAPMQPAAIRASDGLDLPAYLTLPPSGEQKGLPLVLNVHGGPWARDEWGYDPEAQWLANRGYAVLQVNFRGSTGFGKKFLNAGNREWGARMQEDLTDAVRWAVSQGYADSRRAAIYGGSYGGYAALAGAAFTPDLFCCAVDIVGPSSIGTLIESIPPYWEPLKHVFRVRVGDIETEREFLEARSPLFHVDKMEVPLLIAQGANDPRVKQAESEQIVEALRARGKEVEYLLFEDEGHGFSRPENRMAFYAAAERFLAKHLGGRVEEPSEEEARLLGKLRR